MEVIKSVEQAYQEQSLPLNSVEGMIRQVLGWREYINGVYHLMDDDYGQSNWFNHTKPLPDFYWHSSQTQMNCLSQILSQVERTGYAHHQDRLKSQGRMNLVLANLKGISTEELDQIQAQANYWI